MYTHDGAVKPKFHYLMHIPSVLDRLGAIFSAFTTERKHIVVKRAAAAIYSSYERTLTHDHVNRHVNAVQDSQLFEGYFLVEAREVQWAIPLFSEVIENVSAVDRATKAQLRCGLTTAADMVMIKTTTNLAVAKTVGFYEVVTHYTNEVARLSRV